MLDWRVHTGEMRHIPALVACLTAVWVGGWLYGAEESPNAEQAEIRLLRSRIASLQKELNDAKAENSAIRARLLAVGIEPLPTTGPTTAAARPKRIVFVLDPDEANSPEIRSAVSELEQDQWFNVIVPIRDGALPFSRLMVEGKEATRERAKTFLDDQQDGATTNHVEYALFAAFGFRPEAIYFLGSQLSEETLAEVRRLNRGVNARIHTTLPAGTLSAEQRHAFWQIAHDSGGVCVDENGEAIEEPGLPMTVTVLEEPAPVATTKPSIFRVNR